MENQEAKNLNTSEAAKETAAPKDKREQDAAFAQAVALRLNKLLDEGVLTPKVLTRASSEIMEEFIARFSYELIKNERFSPYQEEKIKTMFGARQYPQNKSEDKLVGEEIKEQMRVFLKELRADEKIVGEQEENSPAVTGLLLFGSRMDPEKTPRGEESDIDVIFCADPTEARLKANRNFAFKGLYPDEENNVLRRLEAVEHKCGLGELIEHQIIETPGELLGKIRGTNQECFPIWFCKPKAVYFIGELAGYSENQINKLIQDCLSSEAVKARKQEIIGCIKEQVLYPPMLKVKGPNLGV